MILRVAACGALLSILCAGAATAEAAGRCPDKKFPANARVSAGELDDLFGKVAPAAQPLRFAYVPAAAGVEERRLAEGLDAEAKRLGVVLETTAAGDVLAKAPDALLVAAGANEAKRLADDAGRLGIPTVALGGRLAGARISIAADEARFGAMAAEYLHELFPGGASLAQITGPATTPDGAARAAGFTEEMRFYANLALAGSFATDGTKEGARNAVANAMAAHPEIKGIFAGSDRMALGAVEALKALKLFDVVVVGSDGTLEGREALTQRTIKGTVARFPEKEGGVAVRAALRLLACQQVEPWIQPEQVMLTAKSLEDLVP